MNPCHKDDDDAPFDDMSEHARYVWENYVVESGFQRVYVIAFAAGADCLISIQQAFSDTFYNQVKEIAVIDSWLIENNLLT